MKLKRRCVWRKRKASYFQTAVSHSGHLLTPPPPPLPHFPSFRSPTIGWGLSSPNLTRRMFQMKYCIRFVRSLALCPLVAFVISTSLRYQHVTSLSARHFVINTSLRYQHVTSLSARHFVINTSLGYQHVPWLSTRPLVINTYLGYQHVPWLSTRTLVINSYLGYQHVPWLSTRPLIISTTLREVIALSLWSSILSHRTQFANC